MAPKRYAVKITFVDGMHGESSSGGCSDYLEVGPLMTSLGSSIMLLLMDHIPVMHRRGVPSPQCHLFDQGSITKINCSKLLVF